MREFLRGAMQVHVLHHADDAEVNGAWLATELRRHGYHVSPGTLYPTLHRMEAEGLLRSRADVRDGRKVRLYTVTEKGRQRLAEARRLVGELSREVLGGSNDTVKGMP